MKSEEGGLIDQIEKARQSNNVLWMQLVRLAMSAKPKRAKATLKGILDNDKRIHRLMLRLTQ
jgi:hypothetical protein